MKKYSSNAKKLIYPYFVMFILMLFIGIGKCEAQSRKTLSQEEKDAINELFELGFIGVRGDGWEINPDVWKLYNFQQRKNFTEKLSVYYKNYVPSTKGMEICMFYNMATKKKIARWYKTEYKEYE